MVTTINAAGNRAKIEKDGKYRIFPTDLSSFSSISALWLSEDVAPEGTLSFSIDGDPAQNSELGTINLALTGQPGSRTCTSNMRFAFLDVDVANLPEAGQVMLFLR